MQNQSCARADQVSVRTMADVDIVEALAIGHDVATSGPGGPGRDPGLGKPPAVLLRRRHLARAVGFTTSVEVNGVVCGSSGCRSAVGVLGALGHAPLARALWLHLGPIAPRRTEVVVHGTNPLNGAPLATFSVPTPPEHQAYVGLRLDEIALTDPPPDTAAIVRDHPLATEANGLRVLRCPLAVVWAWARERDDGPGVVWRARRGGGEYRDDIHLPLHPTAADVELLGRELALIKGVPVVRRGRPSKLTLTPAESALLADYLGERRREPALANDELFARIGQSASRMRRIIRQAISFGLIDASEVERPHKEH